MLSGWGTAVPSVNFAPLINELSGSFTTVVVEPFGYGWSDQRGGDSGIDVIVEEYREALRVSGLNPPYIIAPHSISGLYALYWSQKYPLEVESIVGIDSSVPNQFESTNSFNIPSIFSIFEFLGIQDLITEVKYIISSKFYNNDDYDLYVNQLFGRKNLYNIDLVNEINSVKDELSLFNGYSFNSDIPVLVCLSKDNVDNNPTWLDIHKEQISESKKSKLVVIPGSHYLHSVSYVEIATEIKNFIKHLY